MDKGGGASFGGGEDSGKILEERFGTSVVGDRINRINSILIEKSRAGSLDRSSTSFCKISGPVGLKKQHSEGVANVFIGGKPGGQVNGYPKGPENGEQAPKPVSFLEIFQRRVQHSAKFKQIIGEQRHNLFKKNPKPEREPSERNKIVIREKPVKQAPRLSFDDDPPTQGEYMFKMDLSILKNFPTQPQETVEREKKDSNQFINSIIQKNSYNKQKYSSNKPQNPQTGKILSKKGNFEDLPQSLVRTFKSCSNDSTSNFGGEHYESIQEEGDSEI